MNDRRDPRDYGNQDRSARGPSGRGGGRPGGPRRGPHTAPGRGPGNRGGGYHEDRGNRDERHGGGGGGQGGGGRFHRGDRFRNRGPADGRPGGGLSEFLHSLTPELIQAAPRATGILELLREGSGFLRTPENDYLPGTRDIYIPRTLVEKYFIREGAELTGPILTPPNSAKGPVMVEIERVCGRKPEDYVDIPHFRDLVVVDPHQRLNLELPGEDLSTRVMDLFTPIGRGQRAMIVSPPRSGKTVLLQQIASAIALHHPECHLMVLLIDERPEEVTDMRRKVKGEVVASSLDRMASGHVRVAEIVLERARRLVEMGKDVVILLDSLTRLARAYNRENPGSGRTMTGGLDARTMEKPREFFGSARKCEGAGSLTIIATALVDTGSRMDQVIFEEFKGTGNMELVLDRSLAERRIYPAIDINSSGTRREEKLRTKDELDRVFRLRRMLASYKPADAMEMLLPRLRKTVNNPAFLIMLG